MLLACGTKFEFARPLPLAAAIHPYSTGLVQRHQPAGSWTGYLTPTNAGNGTLIWTPTGAPRHVRQVLENGKEGWGRARKSKAICDLDGCGAVMIGQMGMAWFQSCLVVGPAVVAVIALSHMQQF